jgi:hypothetical protein
MPRSDLGKCYEVRPPETVKLRDFVAIAWVNTALPVRSAVLKQDTGGLVVRWVTTSESPLLYVLFEYYFCSLNQCLLPQSLYDSSSLTRL